MSQNRTKRRRWPWLVLCLVLLPSAGLVAWKLRPLTADERAMVGTWRAPGIEAGRLSPVFPETTYRADRRWEFRVRSQTAQRTPPTFVSTGTWSAARGRLVMTYDSTVPLSWSNTRQIVRDFLQGGGRTTSSTYLFRGPDTLSVANGENSQVPWTRVRDAQDSTNALSGSLPR